MYKQYLLNLLCLLSLLHLKGLRLLCVYWNVKMIKDICTHKNLLNEKRRRGGMEGFFTPSVEDHPVWTRTERW